MTIASNPAAAAIPTEAMPAGVDAGSQVPSAAPAATRVTVGAANMGLHPTPVEPAAAVITLLAASERYGTDRCDTDRCDMDRRDMDRLDPNLPDSRPVAANPSDPARSGATVADPTPASADLEQPAATESDLAALTRPDFPLLSQIACLGQPLIYLDYAATSQKPRQVLAALQHYYGHDNANVHRGAHQLSARATEGFEHAREKVATFVGAASPREIVYTRNASEAINLVARTWGEANLRAGDEVLLSVMEHHSNLVPWQLLAARTGCVLRHAGLTPTGELDLADWRSKLSERTRLVSLVQVSNTLG
ncbi:MAG: aminotransferase class V-fold PLP-dependent enzyme, partial [Cyanobium sp.]